MPTEAEIKAAAEAAYMRNREGAFDWDELGEIFQAEWKDKVIPVLTAAEQARTIPSEQVGGEEIARLTEEAWASIVGRDIAADCLHASIVRGDLETAVRAILSRLSLRSWMGKWQPIETAPKNRMLLVGFFNSLGKWRSMHAQYRNDLPQDDDTEDEYAPAGWYEGSLEAEILFPVNPTHWMPPPPPPHPSRRGEKHG